MGKRLTFQRPAPARSRFLTFGLTEKVNITPDDGATDQLVPSAWFLTGLDEATEERIADIVRRAAG